MCNNLHAETALEDVAVETIALSSGIDCRLLFKSQKLFKTIFQGACVPDICIVYLVANVKVIAALLS